MLKWVVGGGKGGGGRHAGRDSNHQGARRGDDWFYGDDGVPGYFLGQRRVGTELGSFEPPTVGRFGRRCLKLAARIAGPALGVSPGRWKRRGPLDEIYRPTANTGGRKCPGIEMGFWWGGEGAAGRGCGRHPG